VALERWARRPGRNDFRGLRARVVLDAARGDQDLEIAARWGMHRRTAARWRARFLVLRLAGLVPRVAPAPRSGRIPERTLVAIVRAVHDAEGSGGVSTRTVAHRLGVSHSTVRRVWARFGLRVDPVRNVPMRPDPVRPRGAGSIVGVYLRGPDLAAAFVLSPEPPGEGRTVLARPMEPPIPEVPPEWTQLDLRTFPTAPGPTGPDVRTRSFLRFLGAVEHATGPGRSVEILGRLPGLEETAPLRRWRARRPNMELRWLPDDGRWMELTTRELTVAGRRSTRASRGQGETSGSIVRFLESFPRSGGAFAWTATAADLERNEAGPRLRYELSVTGHTGFKSPFPLPTAVEGPPDARVREVARVVLRRCLDLRAGEHVAIDSWSSTLELANALTLEAWRIGARPMLLLQDEPTYWAAVQAAKPADLARLGDHLRAAIAHSDALVTFFGPSDRERMHALPWPTRYRLGEYQDKLFAAAARNGTRAVQMALGRVSEASARMYDVDLARWRSELLDATAVDPRELRRRGARLAQRLRTGRTVEITHPNGTRVRFGLKRRRPEVVDGIVGRGRSENWSITTLPAGVVNVALDERVGDGFFRSNVPNSVGVSDAVGEFRGGRWTFEHGRLARYAFEAGQELFGQSYERAGPGKDRPGVLSIGLNDQITMAPLLMDQGAGTLTLQIGRNSHVGGSNTAGWWGWLLLKGADLRIDGTLCLKGGRLRG
jgi:leucyl aminopeptidase (aminopeptidase T)/transposase